MDNTNENVIFKLKDGRNLGYAEYGDRHGTPLFFFHGWPSSRLQAKVLDKEAKKRNIRVISPDRPGYGLSDFAPKRTLLDWADDVIELANSLQMKKFAVVGVSGGGPYAAVCAYKIPSRLTKVGIVVGLAPTDIEGVLMGMATVNKIAWRNYHRFPFLMQLSSTLAFLQARKFLPETLNLSYRAKADQEILKSQEVKNDMARIREQAFRQGKEGCATDLKLYTDDWGFRLKDIKTNVFLWYGDADKNVSLNMGKYYASQIPNSQLKVYPNEGHLIIKNHTEEILKTFQN